MDFISKDCLRLAELNTSLQAVSKSKDKTKKQLWKSLLEVYENEKGVKKNTKGLKLTKSFMLSLDEEMRANNGNISLHKLIDKQLKKKKRSNSKHSRGLENLSNEFEIVKPLGEHAKERKKRRKSERQNLSLKRSNKFKGQEETRIAHPLVVLHERVGENIINSSDRILVEHKQINISNNEPTKLHNKRKHRKYIKRKENCLNNTSSFEQTNLRYEREIVEQHCPITNQIPSNDKVRKRRKRGLVHKISGNDVESKLRRRIQKVSNQQLVREVAKSLGISDDILEKIRSLPMKDVENQLIFMEPSHINKMLELCNFLNKADNPRKHNFETNRNNKSNVKETNSQIGLKINLEKLSLSKELENRTSRKQIRNIKLKDHLVSGTFDHLQNPSSLNVIRDKRKRSKYSMVGKKNYPRDVKYSKKGMKIPHKEHRTNEIIEPSKSHFEIPNFYQNNSSGDAYAEDMNGSQSNKLSTIFSEAAAPAERENKTKESINTVVPETGQIRTSVNDMAWRKFSDKATNKSSKKLNKHSIGEDGKLMFKLVKSGNASEKNKQSLYSINSSRVVRSNEDKCTTPLQKDRLMLFYANQESSSTSKESLNIAISRDTAISNNGSSNNILNVVIKQTKNSVSNTKTSYFTTLEDKQTDEGSCHQQLCKEEQAVTTEAMASVNMNEGERSTAAKLVKDACCQTDQVYSHKRKTTRESLNANTATRNKESYTGPINVKPNGDKIEKVNMACSNRTDSHYPTHIARETNSRNESPIQSDMSVFMPNNNLQNVQLLKFEKIKLGSCIPEEVNAAANTPIENYVDSKSFFRVLDKDEICLSKDKVQLNYGYNPYTQVEVPKDLTLCKQREGIYTTKAADVIKREEVIEKRFSNEEDCGSLELKLKQIGLSKRYKFVKVINSESNLNPITHDAITTKQISGYIPSDKNKTDLNNKANGVKIQNPKNVKETAKDEEEIITTNTRNYISVNNQPRKVEKVNYDQKPSLHLTKSLLNKDINTQNEIRKEKEIVKTKDSSPLNGFFGLVKMNTDLLPVYDEKLLKNNKENFVTVIQNPSKENIGELIRFNSQNVKDLKSIVKNKTEFFLKPGKDFAVTEVGVQTELQDLTSFNTDIHFHQDFKPQEKQAEAPCPSQPRHDGEKSPLVSKRMNNFVSVEENMEPNVLGKKNSFIHVVNSKILTEDENPNISKDCSLTKEVTNNCTIKAEEEMQLRQNIEFLKVAKSEKYQREQQIIYKINAIYEFLQYLDKMLKDNSLMRINQNCHSDVTIGTFNKTLKCLCSNCMEILNKLETSPPPTKICRKDEIKQTFDCVEKKNVSQNKDDKTNFVTVVNEQNKEFVERVAEFHQEQYLNATGPDNPRTTGIHHSNPKPFFVIVPSNEHLNTSCINKKMDVIERGSGDKDGHKVLGIDDEIGSLLMERKIQNFLSRENNCYCSNLCSRINEKNDTEGFKNINQHSYEKIIGTSNQNNCGCFTGNTGFGMRGKRFDSMQKKNDLLNTKCFSPPKKLIRKEDVEETADRCKFSGLGNWFEENKATSRNYINEPDEIYPEYKRINTDCKCCMVEKLSLSFNNQALKQALATRASPFSRLVDEDSLHKLKQDGLIDSGSVEWEDNHREIHKERNETFDRNIARGTKFSMKSNSCKQAKNCVEDNFGNNNVCDLKLKHDFNNITGGRNSSRKNSVKGKSGNDGATNSYIKNKGFHGLNIKNKYDNFYCCRTDSQSSVNSFQCELNSQDNSKLGRVCKKKKGRQPTPKRFLKSSSIVKKENTLNKVDNKNELITQNVCSFSKCNSRINSNENLKQRSLLSDGCFDSDSSFGALSRYTSMTFLNKNFKDHEETNKYLKSKCQNLNGYELSSSKEEDNFEERLIKDSDGWISLSNPNLQDSLNDPLPKGTTSIHVLCHSSRQHKNIIRKNKISNT